MDAVERGLPDFPFSIGRARLEQDGFLTHGHDYAELVIIVSGTGIHRTGQAAYPVRSGDIFVIRRGERHGFEKCRQLDMINLSIKEAFTRSDDFSDCPGVGLLFHLEPQIRKTGDSGSRFHADPLQMEQITEICRELESEFNRKASGYRTMFTSLLTRLLILLGRFYTDKGFSPSRKLQRLASILSEMETRFTEEIDLGDLAESRGYSPAHFIRLFRKAYGITPKQYILQLRIAQAGEMLKNGDMGISEIAWKCGFEDSNYFSRLFRQKVGVSPRNFRKGSQE